MTKQIRVYDKSIGDERFGIESGLAEIELTCGDDFLASWDKIQRTVEYSKCDTKKYNPRSSYDFCLSQIREMAQMAYDAGKRDQQKETSKTLQAIFGLGK